VHALVEDALELRLQVQVVEVGGALLPSQHLHQQLGVHLKELALHLKVEVQVIVSWGLELHLLQVDLDAHVGHVYVLQGHWLVQGVRAPVRKISESVK